VTGKVVRVDYDCHGEFEGFTLEDCGTEHRFHSRQPGIERVVRSACHDHCTLTVCTRGHRIERITIEC
jgi:hypothetical protein